MICGLCKVQTTSIYHVNSFFIRFSNSFCCNLHVTMLYIYIETPERYMNSPCLLPQISKTEVNLHGKHFWLVSRWMTWWGGGWRDCRISKFGVISLAFREARRCLQNCYVLKYHWEAEQWRRSRLRNWVPELEGIVTWMVENGADFLLRLVEIQNDVDKVLRK